MNKCESCMYNKVDRYVRRPLDLTCMINSGIDMEFIYDTGLIIIGKLGKIDKYSCFHPINKDSPSPKCRIRQNHWHNWQGGMDCPLPEGLEIQLLFGNNEPYRGETRTEYGFNNIWRLKTGDSRIIAFKIIGVAYE